MSFSADFIILLLCIPFMAFLYASVGHGGASGYIALMYVFNTTGSEIKTMALVMNIFVASMAFYHYWKQGYFKFNIFLFFAIGSIPFSFLGGYLAVSPVIFNSILLVFLIFSILKLSGILKLNTKTVAFSPLSAIIVGSVIGFSSGLIGIGGGIILTPVLLLLSWAKMKEAAAVSALFILVNSFAGLAGQLVYGINIPTKVWPMVIVAVVGGFIGSYVGANKIKVEWVKTLLVVVLSIAAIKLVNSLWQIA